MDKQQQQIAVVGGGWFGLYIGAWLAERGHRVTIFEKSDRLMGRASYNNQARVHNGYHYPRSVLTALRSHASFPRFVREFSECIYADFDKYYCIGRHLGKVTARQFYTFCRRIGAEIEEAPKHVSRLMNPQYIEACFKTKEYAFDAVKLCRMICTKLDDLQVAVCLNTEVSHIVQQSTNHEKIRLVLRQGTEERFDDFDHVFNCTYSRINFLTDSSGFERIPIKHEMTEMCLVEVPEPIRHIGVTVMCGPFFSVMPFPAVVQDGLPAHSFSHVRYTPHYEWHDSADAPYRDAERVFAEDARHSAWEYMRKDAARYMPLLAECRYLESLWEVKTVLPGSETDDSRPILFRPHYGCRGFHCVMGGKIDNVYDAVEAIREQLEL